MIASTEASSYYRDLPRYGTGHCCNRRFADVPGAEHRRGCSLGRRYMLYKPSSRLHLPNTLVTCGTPESIVVTREDNP
jgi:hypothetical protein